MLPPTLPAGQEERWLGAFGERWFETVCHAAGLSAYRPGLDADRLDFVVNDRKKETIRVQVKTTERPTCTAAGYAFPLPVATYDELREGATPGLLMLVVVSRPHPRWVRYYERGAVVSACIYWADLSGRQPTSNSATITVSLPFSNIVTPATLPELFPGGVV